MHFRPMKKTMDNLHVRRPRHYYMHRTGSLVERLTKSTMTTREAARQIVKGRAGNGHEAALFAGLVIGALLDKGEGNLADQLIEEMSAEVRQRIKRRCQKQTQTE